MQIPVPLERKAGAQQAFSSPMTALDRAAISNGALNLR
jgi:hypothetical protein